MEWKSAAGKPENTVNLDSLELCPLNNQVSGPGTGATAVESLENEDSSPQSEPYLWEVFESSPIVRNKADSRAYATNGPEIITTQLGTIGIVLVRVWQKTTEKTWTFIGHYWNSMVGIYNVFLTILLGMIVPTCFNMLLTLPPLYTLEEPLGSEGLLPFAKIWGWLLQKFMVITVVDMVFICMQTIYLRPSDHFYFTLWPTIVKWFLTFILQDFIPRLLGVFPVPLLDNFIGPFLFSVVTGYHTHVFVHRKLSEYESGTAQPSALELLLSCGRSTQAANARFPGRYLRKIRKKKFERLGKYELNNSKSMNKVNNHRKPRRHSLATTYNLSPGGVYRPSYVVFGRRRRLVLSCLMSAYCNFYLICVAFLLGFRVTRGNDSMHALLAICFTAVSVLFRKILAPMLFQKAKYGGRLWDGEYSKSLNTLEQKFDNRVNTAGFRLSDYFFECLSEIFLTFILPEITSNIVFVLLIVGETLVIYFTAGSWTFLLPKWKSLGGRKTSSVIPEFFLHHISENNEVGDASEVRSRKCLRALSKKLAGNPPYSVLMFWWRSLATGNCRLELKDKLPCSSDMTATALPNGGLKGLRNLSKSDGSTKNILEQKLKRSQINWTVFHQELTQHGLVPFRLVETPKVDAEECKSESRAHFMDTGDIVKLDRNQTKSKDINNISKDEFDWRVTDINEETVMLGWAISRCQTLFVMFFADLYICVSFLCLFTFMVYGYNSESFPYANICTSTYVQIMQYNLIAFLVGAMAIGISDLFIRARFGINIISSGLQFFSHGQSVVPMIITGVLSYALMWGFIVDHARSFLYFTELFGSTSFEC